MNVDDSQRRDIDDGLRNNLTVTHDDHDGRRKCAQLCNDLRPADPLRLAHTVRHVGDILREDKQLEPAGPCYREALEIYRAHEDTPPLDLANAIRGYALLKAETGERQDAIALWQEAGELYAQVHVEAGVAESERRVALLMGG